MLKKLYDCKGWTTTEANLTSTGFFIKLVIDRRYRFSCPKCHTRLIRHSYRSVYVKDLPIVGVHTKLEVEVLHGHCTKYKDYHTLRPNFVHSSMGYTHRLMLTISSYLLHMPTIKLAKAYGISPSSVLRIDKEVLSTRYSKVYMEGRDAILIDEKYLGTSISYVTLVIDARSGEPLYMAKGRDGKCLEPFFESLDEEVKRSIKYLGIDRSNAYKAIDLKYLPHIKICYDAYHLVSNINEVVDHIRNELMRNHPTEALKRRLTGMRYILLKAPEKLNDLQQNRLDELIQYNQPLNIAYMLKEQFRAIFRQPTYNQSWMSLIDWLKMASNSGLKKMVTFAKNIHAKYNEILNALRYKINSGRIESTNAKIGRIVTKCCGLRDIKYLFLKIRQSFYLSQNPTAYQQI